MTKAAWDTEVRLEHCTHYDLWEPPMGTWLIKVLVPILTRAKETLSIQYVLWQGRAVEVRPHDTMKTILDRLESDDE